MTISGSVVADMGTSLSTLKLCPSCGRRPRAAAEAETDGGAAVAQEEEEQDVWDPCCGCDGDRGRE